MVDYLGHEEERFEGNYIPEDIVMQILKRLPVKSVLRFRCVCKGWRDLIRSRFFIDNYKTSSCDKEDDYIMVVSKRRAQDNHSDEIVLSFYDHQLRPMKSPEHFPLVFPHDEFEISTCDSIVCLVADLYSSSQGDIFLCKPATRECRKIPPSPFGLVPGKFPMSKVNRVARVSCGFGADPRTNEYKVVSVMKYWHELPHEMPTRIRVRCIYQVEIYDLSSDSWREVEMALPDFAIKRRAKKGYVFSEPCWGHRTAVLFNGCLHWRYGNNILGFDLSNEAFRNLGLFSDVDQARYGSGLMVVDDSLAILGAGINQVSMSIHVMQEYGVEESWVKRYFFRPYLTSVLTAIPSNHGILIQIYRDGERPDRCYGERPDRCYGDLISYNLSASPVSRASSVRLPHRNSFCGAFNVKAVVVSGQPNLVPLSPHPTSA